jgi:hypothetical protein
MDDRTLAGKPVRRPLQLFNDQSALTKRQNLSIFLQGPDLLAGRSKIGERPPTVVRQEISPTRHRNFQLINWDQEEALIRNDHFAVGSLESRRALGYLRTWISVLTPVSSSISRRAASS